jgi:hypothetical protein
MNSGFFAIILLFIAALLLYFLPALVAERRRHPNRTSIGVLNLLLGWTLIGWVAALVWACTAIEPRFSASADCPDPLPPKAHCPFCAEPIQPAAIKCKHCGSMLTAADHPSR